MGKVLIIKGADFSQVAVAHEIVEPTVFYPVNNNIGSAGMAAYQNGDYYFRCQHGLSDQNAAAVGSNSGLYLKENGSTSHPSVVVGDFVKIKGAYYKFDASESYFGRLISPYYGVKPINVEFEANAYKFVDASTAPTEVSTANCHKGQVALEAGKNYVIFGYGSTASPATYTVAIVKKSNNSYVNLGDGPDINFIEYTAESGDVLYFSSLNNVTGFIAKKTE